MNNSYAFVDPSYAEYLAHYGIPLMKWHHRNYENYDGTLTPAGKERYSVYWKKGKDLKGHKVDYDAPRPGAGRGRAESEKPEVSKGITDYQKPDGSLTAEGRKKYGDILTEKEMQNLVRNYNSANGTRYRVGEVTFRKNGKLYTAEGKRLNENVDIEKAESTNRDENGILDKARRLVTHESVYKEQIKDMKNMSNEDLQKAIDRSKLEKAYIAELGIQKSKGEKFIDNMKNAAFTTATEVGKEAVRQAGNQFLDKVIMPRVLEGIEKMGVNKDDAKKVLDEVGSSAKKAMEKAATEQKAQEQKPQQNGDQKQQQSDSKGSSGNQNGLSKPIEQTSSNDLRAYVKKQNNLSDDEVNKMDRRALENAARKNQSGGQSQGEQKQQSTSNKEENVTVTKDSQGRVTSAEGKLNPPAGKGSQPKPTTQNNTTKEKDDDPMYYSHYSPTYNPRPVDYWTREQLMNALSSKGTYDKSINTLSTDELIERVRKKRGE